MTAALVGFGITACSSSDDNNATDENNNNSSSVSAKNVFTGGLPKTIGDAILTYNDKGQLISCTDNDGNKVTFEYGVTRAAGEIVKMTVDEGEDGKNIFLMTLNEQGYVSHCDQTEDDGNKEAWDFQYNTDGQLTYMKRSENENRITRVIYENGNAVKAINEYQEPKESNDTTVVTFSDIPNKGCIMLFDATLGIDMDEMEVAYFAGLLGKPTKNLPASSMDLGYTPDKETFTWTLNGNGLPTKLTITGYDQDEYIFKW